MSAGAVVEVEDEEGGMTVGAERTGREKARVRRKVERSILWFDLV